MISVAAEFPKLAFTQVAKMLAERWKALTPAEVNHYKKMSEIVELNRRIHREDKEFAKMQSEALGKKNVNLKSLFERIKSKSKLSRPPRKEVSLVASVDKIKQSAKNTSNGSSNCDYQIIGQLHPSCNWLYLKGKEIGHLRHQGLLELITYQKMLSSHDVPRKKLEKSVLITESNLGTSLWAVFVSLDTEYCSSTLKRIISSDVIVKNGFRIEVEMIEDVIFHGNITEVAATIPHFGISELKDALNLYLKNGEIGGLASWRPISVRGYITVS